MMEGTLVSLGSGLRLCSISAGTVKLKGLRDLTLSEPTLFPALATRFFFSGPAVTPPSRFLVLLGFQLILYL